MSISHRRKVSHTAKMSQSKEFITSCLNAEFSSLERDQPPKFHKPNVSLDVVFEMIVIVSKDYKDYL